MTAWFCDFEPVLARVYGYHRDPASIFALILAGVFCQTLIWGIARDTTDVEWWRAFAIAAFVMVITGVLGTLGLRSEEERILKAVGAFAFIVFANWLFSGVLYDFETWQRVVVCVATPILCALAMLGGLYLRNLIGLGVAG